jgi:hypothetical protein
MAVWSTVGSVGVASAADQSKLLLFNSVVQLGPGTGVVVGGGGASELREFSTSSSQARAELRTFGTLETAIIRYGVDVSRDALVGGVNGMRIRYRDGNGFLTARLIAVAFDTGIESILVGFDSRSFGPPQNSFQTRLAITAEGGPIVVSGENVAFYIELTLAVFQQIAVPVAFPPAVSAMELGIETQSNP